MNDWNKQRKKEAVERMKILVFSSCMTPVNNNNEHSSNNNKNDNNQS